MALLVGKERERIKHLPHPSPQAEIMELACDSSKAQALLEWEPKVGLEEGLARTKAWMTEKS